MMNIKTVIIKTLSPGLYYYKLCLDRVVTALLLLQLSRWASDLPFYMEAETQSEP